MTDDENLYDIWIYELVRKAGYVHALQDAFPHRMLPIEHPLDLIYIHIIAISCLALIQ